MIFTEFDDRTLVGMSLTGKDAAYEALVRRWQNAVIGAAYSVVKNYWLAEDAAQDAFVSAWMKLDMLRDHDRYGAWVCRIARNRAAELARRHRDFVDFDELENMISESDCLPDELVIWAEESEALHAGVNRLPEKIRTVIRMHYFEGLSVADIAGRLQLPAGTVKWRLSDGRERLRKDYEMEDNAKALTERIMKRVEELKLWRFRQDKTGFEAQYRELLADIDKMPESEQKYHAMADVLMHGYWWLPGEKNDELIERMRDAAEKSRNEEVMKCILAHETDSMGREKRIQYVLETQIPRLEAAGFKNALAYAWFWLGYEYHAANENAKAKEAFEAVMRVAPKDEVYYANAISALKSLEAELPEEPNLWSVHPYSEEYRYIDGVLRAWGQPGYGLGEMPRQELYDASYIFWHASHCNGIFFDEDLPVGGSVSDANGRTLLFVSDCETVETPCGVFEGCQLWRGTNCGLRQGTTVDTWYKRGVGIVKQAIRGTTEAEQLLTAYKVHGTGLLPFAAGNHWEYHPSRLGENLSYTCTADCVYADDRVVTMAMYYGLTRSGWNENSFDDMMLAMRSGYVQDDAAGSHLRDVSHFMERAELLAAGAYEMAHAKAALAVMRRIFETDDEYSPDHTAKGHWNFFNLLHVGGDLDNPTLEDDRSFSFEWKDMGGTKYKGWPLLFNDVYELLFDNVGVIWSDAWTAGTETEISRRVYSAQIQVKLKVCDAGTIVTAAGSFDGCIEVSLDATGFTGGLGYRGGRKEYYFAPGVGIVRMVSHFHTDEPAAVYELTAYEGTGEGMMPLGEGFMRRYDAVGLTDGYEAWTNYYYEKDPNGRLVIFADRAGIKALCGC